MLLIVLYMCNLYKKNNHVSEWDRIKKIKIEKDIYYHD